jgi:general stress protein 26
MSEAQAKIDHAWDLMGRIEVGLLVTHDGHGDHLKARPVHAHLVAAECAIYFLTDAASAKTHEIDGNENVCIAFADIQRGKYVSATGAASVLDDRAKVEELWTKSDKAFWASPDDPSVRVVRIDPSVVEYWDSFGAIVTAARTAAARVAGTKPVLRENETFELPPRRAH